MAIAYTKGMEAEIPGGLKIVQYTVGTEGTEEAITIAANSIGLSTIMSAFANNRSLDAASIRAYWVGIGTYTAGKGDANYATVRAYNIKEDGDSGTMLCGTFEILALGL